MGVGEFVITVPEGGEVVLAVGAMAPFTQERASYTLRVDPLGAAAEGENAP